MSTTNGSTVSVSFFFAALALALGAGMTLGAGAAAASNDIDVSVPLTDLTPSQGAEVRSVAKKPVLLAPRYGEGARIEVSASSWVPGALTMPSHLSDATAFSSSGIPEASLRLVSSPFVRFRQLSVSLLAGVSLGVVQRTGTYLGDDSSGGPSQVSEYGYVVPVELGAEANVLIHGPFSAYGDLALLPVAAFGTRTVFVQDEGAAEFGLPIELSLGLSNDLRWIGASFQGIRAKAGVVATANTFGSADFSGLGGDLGVSFPL